MLVALLLGVHATGLFVLNPVLRSMEVRVYVPVKHAVDRTAPRLAKPLMLACLAVTTAALFAAVLTGAMISAVADAVALIALVVTLLAILRGDLPINRSMAHWSPDAPPADWRTTRTRWERFFGIRTATNLVALLAIGVSVVASASELN
ncbi:hypothetical protein [Microbacterium sp.]|uniref:hypothetical protein n=1 Tax=Microbacterium sp. TaxID=51671 RepID=UPI003561B68A